MPKAVKLVVVAVLFGAGVLVAGTIARGQTTEATTTESGLGGRTIVETTTLERTTTRLIPVPATTSASTEETGTPAWVWVLLGILAVGLVVLIVLLARRGRGGGTIPVDERRRHLDAAVGSWTAQGWAIDNETADSAILRRANESMLVSVDGAGHVSTRPLSPG